MLVFAKIHFNPTHLVASKLFDFLSRINDSHERTLFQPATRLQVSTRSSSANPPNWVLLFSSKTDENRLVKRQDPIRILDGKTLTILLMWSSPKFPLNSTVWDYESKQNQLDQCLKLIAWLVSNRWRRQNTGQRLASRYSSLVVVLKAIIDDVVSVANKQNGRQKLLTNPKL